jgi:hypothetical protein
MKGWWGSGSGELCLALGVLLDLLKEGNGDRWGWLIAAVWKGKKIGEAAVFIGEDSFDWQGGCEQDVAAFYRCVGRVRT